MFKRFIDKILQNSQAEIPKHKRPPLILKPSEPTIDIRPKPTDTCFCGSDKLFQSCCGSIKKRRPLPYGVFVENRYLDKSIIKELVEYAERQQGKRMLVIDKEASTADNIVKVKHQKRSSDRIEMGKYQNTMNQFVKTAFTELAGKYLHCELDWFETPQLMRYETGGTYLAHADNENMNTKTRTWSRVVDRDLSLLIYLNDEFMGGKLHFDKFNCRILPKPGMAVLFPSDNRYMHAAEEVTAGVRYVIVSWASVKGIEKVSSKPPKSIIPINYYPQQQ